MTILETVEKIVEQNGIQIDETGELSEIDSITFVQIVVDIEVEFNITIPDAFLHSENYPNIESLAYMISEILDQK